jgi:hydrogenase-4 component F
VAGLFLLMLVIVFIGMGATVLTVVQGEPAPVPAGSFARERLLTVAPVAFLLALVLMLGVYVPRPLDTLLRAAAASLETP